MKMLLGALAGCAVVAATAAVARAEEAPAPPRHWLFYQNLFALRYNPLGAFEEFRLSYRYRLLDSPNVVLRDTFAGIGVVPRLSPAWWRLGAFAEIQPLAILQLTAEYEVMRYFGAFNLMQSFPTARSEYSDTDLDRLSDEGRTYVTTGRQLTLAALLQLKVGGLVLRSNTRAIYTDMSLRAGDTVYYDVVLDLLAPGKGWILANDTDVLWFTRFGFVGGIRYSVGHAFYDETHLPPGPDPGNVPNHRLGPFLAYNFRQKEGAAFNNPTVVLLAQWWLSHRYRTGRDVSQGVPLIAIAFTFNGDLWRSK